MMDRIMKEIRKDRKKTDRKVESIDRQEGMKIGRKHKRKKGAGI